VGLVRRAGKPVLAEGRLVTHPERIIPDESAPGIVALHLKRYVFAEPYCAGKEVLDAACGAGYGSAHLAKVASNVVGVDADEEAIAYARRRYAAPNAHFQVMDVASLDFADSSFDVVCSFETIEHVPDRDAFLREAARVLRPDGTFLVSTPQVRRTTEHPANPFHHVEYARADFERLLGSTFERVELYGQRRLQTRRHLLLQRLDVLGLRRRLPFLRPAAVLVGTAPTAEVTLEGIVIEQAGIERAGELVAVCGGPRRR
jgi:ubiquinone/menaquinone biosynthesis C-methylase UbiE